jgi:hypothetical protein
MVTVHTAQTQNIHVHHRLRSSRRKHAPVCKRCSVATRRTSTTKRFEKSRDAVQHCQSGVFTSPTTTQLDNNLRDCCNCRLCRKLVTCCGGRLVSRQKSRGDLYTTAEGAANSNKAL